MISRQKTSVFGVHRAVNSSRHHAPRLALAGSPPAGAQVFWTLAQGGEASPADERQAFEARMQAAWPGVVRLVERLLAWPGSGSEVEDIAQETFLAAWRARDAFRGEAEWATWVHSIALRRARNAGRARERRLRWFGRPRPAADLEALSADTGAVTPTAAVDPGDVRDTLGRLRHADREVLVLRYLEGLTVEEVAVRLELGRAAVDARLSRARKRMRGHLGGPTDSEVR